MGGVTSATTLDDVRANRHRFLTPPVALSSLSLKIWASRRVECVNSNHPVLNALEAQLRELRLRYEHHPSEHNRYQLVKLERLITEWAPGSLN